MIKKLIFSGCSTTAGNELWEEANIPNYKSMTFKEARVVMNDMTIHESELRAYNCKRAYPAIVGETLGIEVVNLSWPGQSNKEIVGRLLSYFKEDSYENTLAFIQITTHNRFLMRFKTDNDNEIAGSFCVVPNGSDPKLTKSQNNLLKEMFFEFLPEAILSLDDYVYIGWAIEKLRKKGVVCYALTPDDSNIDWADESQSKSASPIKNDRDPQFLEQFGYNLVRDYKTYELMPDATFKSIAGKESVLPRLHFNQSAQYSIADRIVKELKNVKLV
jgi:hypothetical protein